MRHQRNWIGLQLQCTCMSKRFVFEVFYCSLYLRDFSLVLASSIANLNGTINNPSFLEKLIVLFASNGYTQVLFPHEERQTILMTETATKNVPCLFLPSTCQGTGPVTACDWVESRRVLHILSPKAWVSCSGIKQNLLFTLVWNHSSGQSKLLKNQWWK